MASPTFESANAALWTCSSCLASSISPSHSSSAMERIFSLKAGDGDAQVPCAPWLPTLVCAAAAGKEGAWAEPAPPKSRRWEEGIEGLPGINTLQPLAWINNYGEGRSFTITIGHDIDTFRRIEFIRMFPRGVEWAASGKVTIEGPDRRGERRFLPWPYYNHEG
ncbi:hypothetical protein ARTHRO9AX_20026 [Arthrobacter sp. 9AX]|uniref:ThuA domain-containing protein n=1 Tax=Arthrobacter sp. 9AX TaxID=2653131 RepID=UPI0012F15738|nr:ThuA domain-containing protein [Arthrobacter sp. 9AX]VXB83619.1 hypothetical protein ARTHRO9AX_20026 [Arthrobacter sp. 9AX]